MRFGKCMGDLRGHRGSVVYMRFGMCMGSLGESLGLVYIICANWTERLGFKGL